MNRTVFGLALSLSISVAARADVPKVLSFTGTLSDASGPVPDGNHDVTFRFFQSVSGGTAFWQNAYSLATVSGVFTALLGTNSAALEPSFFASDQVWLEIAVEGDLLGPRMRVVSVPYALAAASLDCVGCVQADHVDLSEVQGRVTGSCPDGQAVRTVNQNGTVVCGSAGASLTPGPGIDIGAGIVSTSFASFSCTDPDKLCGFDAAGDPLCCPDQGGTATLNFNCPGSDLVAGWDALGNPVCEPDDGGAGGGVTQVNAIGGLTGGPITDTGTLSIADSGVTTAKIAPSAVSETVGFPDLLPLCVGGAAGAMDACDIGTLPVVLFERTLTMPGLHMFYVHLNAVSHTLSGGNALGLQLNNATSNMLVDPDPGLPGETWDYIFTSSAATQSISRVFVYEKPAAGLETLEVRAWTNGGSATIQPYASGLAGFNAGMHVVLLKR